MKRMAQRTLAVIGRALLESAPYTAAASPFGVWPVEWPVGGGRLRDSDAPRGEPLYRQGESAAPAAPEPA